MLKVCYYILEAPMTTVLASVDEMLIEVVKSIVLHHKYSQLPLMKDLLDRGADPHVVLHKTSAYQFVLQRNKDGEFAALLDEFEDHLESGHSREGDSTYEGLVVRR